jgi:hypothetical protein
LANARSTKASIPTKPARTIYTTKSLDRSPPKSVCVNVSDDASSSKGGDQHLKLQLENMEGIMTALKSQISVMQSQYMCPPTDSQQPSTLAPQPYVPQLNNNSPIQVHVPIQMPVAPQPQRIKLEKAPKPKKEKVVAPPREKKPPRYEERIVVQKVIKKVPKPKPPKPVVDTTPYTNQIAELKEKLDDLVRAQTEEEFHNQLASEGAHAKQQFLNVQLETLTSHIGTETEKGYQLKSEVASRSAANSQMEFNFMGAKAQLEEQIETQRSELTGELKEKNRTNADELARLQAELEFFRAECVAREKARVELDHQIVEEIEMTARTEKRIRASETLRKKLHNEIQELKGNIRVICRVRPLLGKEKAGGVSYAFPKGGQEMCIEKKAINDVTSKKSTAGSSGTQISFFLLRMFSLSFS